MGGSNWSDMHYANVQATRKATGQPTFAYSAVMQSAPPSLQKVHQNLDPRGVNLRESRDSVAHPESLAISVFFDVTGSMGTVPSLLQKSLPSLMGLLMRKGFVPHPQVMFGAIGDIHSSIDPNMFGGDKAPLQVGQFESGVEMEGDLTNIWLEGGGWGQRMEDYELALYFMARHTSIDCFEKRDKRGYMFLIGDEMPWPEVDRRVVQEVMGETLEANISVEEIVAEAKKQYDVWFIIPNLTSYYREAWLENRWRALLGEQVIRLEDVQNVSEVIAMQISVAEGQLDTSSVVDYLADSGLTQNRAQGVSKALVPVSRPVTGTAVGLPVANLGGSGVVRL